MHEFRREMCSDGKLRKHYHRNCKQCNKEFWTILRKGKGKTFCSKDCSILFHKKEEVELNCAFCKENFIRRATQTGIKISKSGFYFCSKNCKNLAQRLGGIKEIQPPHYGTRTDRPYETATYRKIWIKAGNCLECKRCGYNEFESSIHIHHIDRNYLNNSIENLISLCSNCHFALHHNRWKLEQIE